MCVGGILRVAIIVKDAASRNDVSSNEGLCVRLWKPGNIYSYISPSANEAVSGLLCVMGRPFYKGLDISTLAVS